MNDRTSSSRAEEFCGDFMEGPVSRRYFFGVNEYSQALSEGIDVAGFVDDFYASRTFRGKPVLRLEEVPAEALVVATLVGKPQLGKKLLDRRGLRHLDFFGFYENCPMRLPEVRFWGRHRRDYAANRAKYQWVRELLSDEASIEVFDRLIGLRETGNIEYLSGFSDRPDLQYFESFITFANKHPVFVDVGAYDGQTSVQFISRHPGFGKVYAFEPEAANAAIAQANLSQWENVQVIRKGLSNFTGTAGITSEGSRSSLREVGEQPIEVDTLDHCVADRVSYLKMDIEGAEYPALEGAQATIQSSRPHLAIAVYHHTEDLWRIPERVMSYHPYEEIRLRHYSEGVVETIMYFLASASR